MLCKLNDALIHSLEPHAFAQVPQWLGLFQAVKRIAANGFDQVFQKIPVENQQSHGRIHRNPVRDANASTDKTSPSP